MAAESEIIRLLFSMSGVRSIYSMFLQGPNKVNSAVGLAERVSSAFPTADIEDVSRLTGELWKAYIAGRDIEDYIYSLRSQAGAAWPLSVASGDVPGSLTMIGESQYGRIPTLTVPGASSARYIITGLVTATVQLPNGQLEVQTIQLITVWTDFPTYQELVGAFTEQAVSEWGSGRYNFTLYVDPSTGGSDLSITITTSITTVP